MLHTHILGFPRIGAGRELKFSLEAYWRGASEIQDLEAVGRALRAKNWASQRHAGLSWLTVGDFSFYDAMLDHAWLFDALPARFGLDAARPGLAAYFALARGTPEQPALEMTKWFDTNYHYLVPEIDAQRPFALRADRRLAELDEALALGHPVKPVLIGPVSFLRLARASQPGLSLVVRVEELAACYAQLLRQFAVRGIEWVQLDEPVLALDLTPEWLDALELAYAGLADCGVKCLLTTGYGSVAHHAASILRLPVAGLHLDLVRAPEQAAALVPHLRADQVLSAGIVDGRNIWRTDPDRALACLRPLHVALGERLWLAPSCTLLHVPVSLAGEDRLDPTLRAGLAFAEEKLAELRLLAAALVGDDVEAALADARAACARRRAAAQGGNMAARVAAITPEMARRCSPYAQRRVAQAAALKLPLLPTTTIGSFPQTAEIRAARAAWKRCELGELDYLQRMRTEIAFAIRCQEDLGLDVLVHGEAERNDMVEFFAERLPGFAVSSQGWVQSYGSRCVKPPILHADVWRAEPLTVATARYAQSLTTQPVKGMLTGPVTLLQWSFVRDDQPRSTTQLQLALAIRAEVCELEAAGIAIIQIDEPAFREGLPLRQQDWGAYLDAAGHAFRVAACGVNDATQIHTHMCYSEFNDILPAIAAMDADVITIETSRSAMALLDGFGRFDYPNEIGPGVYDIHAPRVPPMAEMLHLLERACAVIPPERLWVNPDCGLKTRNWPETEAALTHMVAAAQVLRARLTERAGEVAGDAVGVAA